MSVMVEPQSMRALAKANRVRLARADVKRRVAAGEVSVADVLAEQPFGVDRMAVAELLIAQPRWGVTRTRRLLRRAAISETRTIEALTDRQRRLIAEALDER